MKRLALLWMGITIGLLAVAPAARGQEAMESNKNVVRQYVERFNAGDLDGLRQVFAEDGLVYGVLGWGKVADVTPIWAQLIESLGIQLHIEDMAAEGDIVAVRYTERGTSRAPFFDKPATGKSYEMVAMEWFEIRDGKIQRRWGARDSTTQAKQLGWDTPEVQVHREAVAD